MLGRLTLAAGLIAVTTALTAHGALAFSPAQLPAAAQADDLLVQVKSKGSISPSPPPPWRPRLHRRRRLLRHAARHLCNRIRPGHGQLLPLPQAARVLMRDARRLLGAS
jgi:hypothetical protein